MHSREHSLNRDTYNRYNTTNNYNYNDEDNDSQSLKRIMCYNKLNNKVCNYGNKCMYAHGTDEQRIDPIRHKVYTMLKNDNSMDSINLVSDKKLYNTLVHLTKVCKVCSKGICPGGYNCRNGATNLKYKVCYDDLSYGNCNNQKCNALHLTNRGLTPYYLQMSNKMNKTNIQFVKNSTLHIKEDQDQCQDQDQDQDQDQYQDQDELSTYGASQEIDKVKTNSVWDNVPLTIKTKHNDIISNKVEKTISLKQKTILKSIDNLNGVLLTEQFLIKHFGTCNPKEKDGNESEESSDNLQSMLDFLNEDYNTDSCDESIFLN